MLIGSLLGNGVMWLASEVIIDHVDKQHPVIRYGGIVLVIGLIIGIESAYRRAKRRASVKRSPPVHPDTH